MNNKQIVALAIVAFLIGDAEAAIRGKIALKRQHKKFQNIVDIQGMKVIALTELVNEAVSQNDLEGAWEKFEETRNFINLIEGSI